MEPADTPANEAHTFARLVSLTRAVVVLLLLLLALQAWQTIAGLTTRPQAWEYAIESPRDEELMKRLAAIGNSGWEIVSARRAVSEVDGRNVSSYELIVKRPSNGPSGERPPIP